MPRHSTEGVPHTGLTDHTIPRRPASPAAESPAISGVRGGPRSPAVRVTDLVPFDDAAARLPARDVDRARGLHLVAGALASRDPAGVRLAESLLVPLPGGRANDAEIIAALGDDTEALAAVAAIRDATGRGEAAAVYWQRVLDLEPEDEQALAAVTEHLGRAGRLSSARSFADRLVAAHPGIAAHHALQSRILAASGADEAAVAAARAAVDRDPARVSFRRWLAEGLRRTGRIEQADAQADLARRIEAALARPAADRQGPPSTRSSTVSD